MYQRLSEKINFRLTKKDYDFISQIAKSKNISVHQLTRSLLLEASRNHKNNNLFNSRFV